LLDILVIIIGVLVWTLSIEFIWRSNRL